MKTHYFYPPALVCSFLFFLVVHLTFINRVYRNSNEEITIKINRGDNLRSVALKLQQGQVIFNEYIFIIAGRLLGYQEQIIPGEYKFSNGLTNLNVLKEITDAGVNHTYVITIPEGLNVRQIGRLLARQHGLDSAKFVRETYNDSLVNLLNIQAENMEGFLYPDTYIFTFTGASNRESEIVKKMASEFRNKITPEMYDEMKRRKLTLKEIITMASIVEGETRFEAEKSRIAGVYYNRLNKGMRLEADPTVQFALPDGPKRVLLYSDLKIQSPYNTYLKKGLPPGPINNPPLSSIMAALYPEENKFLYFVAKGDGSHRFAETYAEHKKNIELYKKYLKEIQEEKEEKEENEKNNK